MILQLAQTIAIVAELSGVILLFRYGMPYRVRSFDGRPTLTWLSGDGSQSEELLRLDRKHTRLGWLGLALIATGSVSQAILLWF